MAAVRVYATDTTCSLPVWFSVWNQVSRTVVLARNQEDMSWLPVYYPELPFHVVQVDPNDAAYPEVRGAGIQGT